MRKKVLDFEGSVRYVISETTQGLTCGVSENKVKTCRR